MSAGQESGTSNHGLVARENGDKAMQWATGDGLRPGDAYWEGPYLVFTEQYHLRRGYCCNSDCRHCPYR